MSSDIHFEFSSVRHLGCECRLVHLRYCYYVRSVCPLCVQLEQNDTRRPLYQSNTSSSRIRCMGYHRGCLHLVVTYPESVETATSYSQKGSFEPGVRFGFYVSVLSQLTSLYTSNYLLIYMRRDRDIAVSIIRLITVKRIDFADIGYSVEPAALAALAEPAIAVLVACAISSRPVFEKFIPRSWIDGARARRGLGSWKWRSAGQYASSKVRLDNQKESNASSATAYAETSRSISIELREHG